MKRINPSIFEMNKSYICYKPTFRFHRWNHKSYSAFASLGKQITIGRLTTDVTDGLLRDQHIRVLALAPLVLYDTDDAPPPDIWNDIVLNQLEETIVTESQSSTAYPAFAYYYCLTIKSYLWALPTDRIFYFLSK